MNRSSNRQITSLREGLQRKTHAVFFEQAVGYCWSTWQERVCLAGAAQAQGRGGRARTRVCPRRTRRVPRREQAACVWEARWRGDEQMRRTDVAVRDGPHGPRASPNAALCGAAASGGGRSAVRLPSGAAAGSGAGAGSFLASFEPGRGPRESVAQVCGCVSRQRELEEAVRRAGQGDRRRECFFRRKRDVVDGLLSSPRRVLHSHRDGVLSQQRHDACGGLKIVCEPRTTVEDFLEQVRTHPSNRQRGPPRLRPHDPRKIGNWGWGGGASVVSEHPAAKPNCEFHQGDLKATIAEAGLFSGAVLEQPEC
jgi:hypothetical protein